MEIEIVVRSVWKVDSKDESRAKGLLQSPVSLPAEVAIDDLRDALSGASDMTYPQVVSMREIPSLESPPVHVLIHPNGNIGVFNAEGQQIPELQIGWMEFLFSWLESNGVDPSKVKYTAFMGGIEATIQPFKTSENRWNWRIGWSR